MGKIALDALAYAIGKVGGKYSQRDRWQDNPYTRDCSSFMYSAWEAAGLPLKHMDTGAKVHNSTTEVYARGFRLLYPARYTEVGKADAAPQSLVNALSAGDMLFYATRADRANKIGHVAMALGDGKNIVHARNPDMGICYDVNSYMEDKLCAIIRYQEAAASEGWVQDGAKWRYVKAGKAQTGWQKLTWSGGEDWFYFDSAGIMLTGWQKLEWTGKTDWYYFNVITGAMTRSQGVQDKTNKNKLWWVGKDGKMYSSSYSLTLT